MCEIMVGIGRMNTQALSSFSNTTSPIPLPSFVTTAAGRATPPPEGLLVDGANRWSNAFRAIARRLSASARGPPGNDSRSNGAPPTVWEYGRMRPVFTTTPYTVLKTKDNGRLCKGKSERLRTMDGF